VQLTFHTGGVYDDHTAAGADDELTLYDANAQNDYRVNSPAGEYGLLFTSSTGNPSDASDSSDAVGHIYYQTGIAVITSSVFDNATFTDADGTWTDDIGVTNYFGTTAGDSIGDGNNLYDSFKDALVSGSISGSCDGIRNRIKNIQFNNTTELNSTIYFCRASHNEFNYSSSPTYLAGSKLRVKNTSLDSPVSYITTVGLYSADNELLAVAKLSEPLKKTPDTELTLRVRLDY